MNKVTFEMLLEDLFEKVSDTLTSKGNDYANDDILSNFKYAGNICQISPEKQCLSLIATKVARLGNLLKENAIVNNESIEDSIKDLICYSVLLHIIRNEDEGDKIVFSPTREDDFDDFSDLEIN